jgi:membrane-associated protease RseP (regulator of RpoE activity)
MISFLHEVLRIIYVTYIVLAIHEAGHFIVAYKFAMAISSVEVGAGPRLTEFIWKGIWFRLYCLPLFGYVKTCWPSKKRWKNNALYLGGPAINLLTALLLYLIFQDLDKTTFCGVMTRISLGIGLGNLIPFRLWGMDSDGLQIMRSYFK